MLIKKIKSDYSFSSSKIARELDISESMITLLENGKRLPSIKLINKIKQTFNYSYDEIFECINNSSSGITKYSTTTMNTISDNDFETDIKKLEKIEVMVKEILLRMKKN